MKKLLSLFTLCAVAGGIYTAATLPAEAQHNRGKHQQGSPARIYRNVRAQIVEVVKPKRRGDKTAVTLDHEDIPNFMRAMRMKMPLKNSRDAFTLKPGDKIQFDMVLQDGNFLVANIRSLPKSTKLKLAKH
jgi:Cu/Ag efflux protein CusF